MDELSHLTEEEKVELARAMADPIRCGGLDHEICPDCEVVMSHYRGTDPTHPSNGCALEDIFNVMTH